MRAAFVGVVSALVTLNALVASSGAQSTDVTIVGRVLRPDDTPAQLAVVTLTPLDGHDTKTELTNGDGRFRVVMARRVASYAMTVRLRGYTARGRRVDVGAADSIVSVPDVLLVRAAQELPAVRTVSRRPPPVRDQGRYRDEPG